MFRTHNYELNLKIHNIKLKKLLSTHPEFSWSHLLPLFPISRSSHRKCSVKKSNLKNFADFTGKQNLKFAKLSRTPILKNIC